MNMHISEIGTLNQLIIRGSYTEINFSKKLRSLWQICVLMICPFLLPIVFVLTLAFERSVLYGSVAPSIVVLSTKKLSSSFSKKVFVFQKTCFKAKTIEDVQISSDRHIKICQSHKVRPILKIPSTAF